MHPILSGTVRLESHTLYSVTLCGVAFKENFQKTGSFFEKKKKILKNLEKGLTLQIF